MKLNIPKIAIISDIHMGVHQSSELWHQTSLNFASWLKNTLHERDIKDVVILGDVLHDKDEVAVTTLDILTDFFKILEDFNIIITIGNHDCYYMKRSDVHSLGSLGGWPNIEIVDELISVNLFNKTLTFCPWHANINDVPESDVIFGHFEINSFKMNTGYVCNNGINSSTLLDKAPLIISGHFHNTEVRDYKKGSIVYTGSPYQQNWGEAGIPKGIYTYDILKNKMTFIENDYSPKHVNIKLSELLSVGLTENIKNTIKGNIICFTIDEKIEQTYIDKILTSFSALKPLSLIHDDVTENDIIVNDMLSGTESIGIDIKSDILHFVEHLENISNKDEHVEYLETVYEMCKSGKKEREDKDE
jgi:DNA repair exonuclease SbcCD nuclease subunit